MTPESQQIACAELCGWKCPTNAYPGYGIPPNHPTLHHREMPDFTTDLNAAQAAFKALTEEQQKKACWLLVQLLDGWHDWEADDYDSDDHIFWEAELEDVAACLLATPAQWCEAILRSISKWETNVQ